MNLKKIAVVCLILLINLKGAHGTHFNYKVLDALYSRNINKKIFRISCETKCTTMFVLPPGEKIADIIEPTGDWIISCDNKRFIYVVPGKAGIHTSLDLITKNSRIYSFILQEVSKKNTPGDIVKKVLIRERINYLSPERKPDYSEIKFVERKNLRKINSNYKIRDRYFKIRKVEDDGIITRIYFGKSQIKPAVFIRKKGKNSRYEPVRYTGTGESYIIHIVIKKGESIVLKTGRFESIIRRK